MKIRLPWPPANLSPNRRMHWAKKSKSSREYRIECFVIARNALNSKLRMLVVSEHDIKMRLTFYPPDKRKRDDDNIIASFKAGRDGLADALMVDDYRFRVQYEVKREPVKGGMVEVVIE